MKTSRYTVRAAGAAMVLYFLLITLPAGAATWRVAPDGSGTHTAIQDAVDAAAEGDTVLIAAGRYLDLADTGFHIDSFIYVPQANLTIIGEDRDGVVIGPAVADYLTPEPVGLYTDDATGLVVRSLTFVNCVYGIDADNGTVLVEDCRFDHCATGIDFWYMGDLTVVGSVFDDGVGYGIRAEGTPSLGISVDISDSEFNRCGSGISVAAVPGARISGSTLNDCSSGVDFAYTSDAELRSCEISGTEYRGVTVRSTSTVTLVDNRIQGGSANLGVYYHSHVEGTGNVFENATYAAITAQEGATLDMHGNDILPGGDYSVSIGTLYPADGWVIQHLEDNYWGTTEQAQIETWIRDGNDITTVYSEVSFLPLREQTVAVKERSLGGLKSLFR